MFNVVIADDDPFITESLPKLIRWGELAANLAYVASNGAEALEYIQEQGADMLITDVKMPKMGGLELCRRVSALPDAPEMVVISGYSEFQYAQEAMRYGIRHYVVKPIAGSKLIELSRIISATANERKREEVNVGSDLWNRVKQYVGKHYCDNDISLNSVSYAFGISVSSLRKMFSSNLNMSLWDYVTQLRFEKTECLLLETQMSVSKISESVGYQDGKYFMRLFKQHFDQTPTEYRNTNRRE